jgi:hypothetical protein
MKYLLDKRFFRKWQAVVAVLLFLFFTTGNAWAGFYDELNSGRPLQEVIEYALDYGMTVRTLVDELVAANKDGSEIICGLFQAGQDHIAVIIAALDAGLSSSDLAGWADNCGATQLEIQIGYSMAGENLPAHYDEEYLYNPPSPSK